MRVDDDLREPVAAHHEHHETIDSTNTRALQWSREGAPHGAIVTAEAQSAGRGRMGRAWESSGNADLYASVVLRPPPLQHSMGALGLAVGVALRQAIETTTHGAVVPDLKWPNDLLVSGRKLGGILIETRWTADRAEIVAGFGINVGRSRFTEDLAATATSLAILLQPDDRERPGRRTLVVECLARVLAVSSEFFAGGFPAIRARYEPSCVTLGREVSVASVRPDGTTVSVFAEAMRLDPDGALVVRPRGGGPEFQVRSGDVWLTGDDSGDM